jgi:hypothetical protein
MAVLSEGLKRGRERKRSWTPVLSEGLNQFVAGPRFEPPRIYTVDCIRGAIIMVKHFVQLSHCSGVSPINAKSRNSWSSFECTSLPRVSSSDDEVSSLRSPCKSQSLRNGAPVLVLGRQPCWQFESKVDVNLHNFSIYPSGTDHLSYLRHRSQMKVKLSLW